MTMLHIAHRYSCTGTCDIMIESAPTRLQTPNRGRRVFVTQKTIFVFGVRARMLHVVTAIVSSCDKSSRNDDEDNDGIVFIMGRFNHRRTCTDRLCYHLSPDLCANAEGTPPEQIPLRVYSVRRSRKRGLWNTIFFVVLYRTQYSVIMVHFIVNNEYIMYACSIYYVCACIYLMS